MLTILSLALVAVVAQSVQVYNHSVHNADGVLLETSMRINEPTICDSDVKQKSGYLKAGTLNNYFFWFFESRSSPSSDPLIMWLTGGPGCSSQLALLAENGPCRVKSDGISTYENPESWNSRSNLMFVDQPPGTGFSTGFTVTTEEQVASDMWAFLQNFITSFPAYFENGFYVIGESYAGHYVPNVMNYIWQQNNAGAGTRIPLLGFGIGNGLTQPLVQFKYYANMAYNSSSALNSPFDGIPISDETYNQMMKDLPACESAIEQCNDSGSTSDCDNAYAICTRGQIEPVTRSGVNPYNLNIACGNDNLCYNFTAENHFLNDPVVQQQIGVDMKWESCDRRVNIRLESDWTKDYQDKVIGPIEDGVRGLIYAGDLDFICNWLGNQAWALELPWKGKDAFNNAHLYNFTLSDGTSAGTIRQGAGINNFTFVRVFNAGHMVPMDQPTAALDLVNRFITNTL